MTSERRLSHREKSMSGLQNPVGFVDALLAANGGGLIYVQMPCFDGIRRSRAWFDNFYEHVIDFRIGDFSRMFERG
jgi:hypothetical protein